MCCFVKYWYQVFYCILLFGMALLLSTLLDSFVRCLAYLCKCWWKILVTGTESLSTQISFAFCFSLSPSRWPNCLVKPPSLSDLYHWCFVAVISEHCSVMLDVTLFISQVRLSMLCLLYDVSDSMWGHRLTFSPQISIRIVLDCYTFSFYIKSLKVTLVHFVENNIKPS